MVQDLHAHTYYSFDCNDTPERVIETAILNGITTLGISDHNHGVGLACKQACYNQGTHLDTDYDQALLRYFDHIRLLKDKYAKKIKILCGIEIATCIGKDNYALPTNADVSFFGYCLVEGLDNRKYPLRKAIFFPLPNLAVAVRGLRTPIYFPFWKNKTPPIAILRKWRNRVFFGN